MCIVCNDAGPCEHCPRLPDPGTRRLLADLILSGAGPLFFELKVTRGDFGGHVLWRGNDPWRLSDVMLALENGDKPPGTPDHVELPRADDALNSLPTSLYGHPGVDPVADDDDPDDTDIHRPDGDDKPDSAPVGIVIDPSWEGRRHLPREG